MLVAFVLKVCCWSGSPDWVITKPPQVDKVVNFLAIDLHMHTVLRMQI